MRGVCVCVRDRLTDQWENCKGERESKLALLVTRELTLTHEWMNCFQRFITLAPFSSVRYERREIVRSGVLCQLSFCKEFGLIGHLIFTLTFNLHGPPHLPKFKFPPLSPFLAHLPLSFFFVSLPLIFTPSLSLSLPVFTRWVLISYRAASLPWRGWEWRTRPRPTSNLRLTLRINVSRASMLEKYCKCKKPEQ